MTMSSRDNRQEATWTMMRELMVAGMSLMFLNLLTLHSQSRSDGKKSGAARRKNSYPMPAIP